MFNLSVQENISFQNLDIVLLSFVVHNLKSESLTERSLNGDNVLNLVAAPSSHRVLKLISQCSEHLFLVNLILFIIGCYREVQVRIAPDKESINGGPIHMHLANVSAALRSKDDLFDLLEGILDEGDLILCRAKLID